MNQDTLDKLRKMKFFGMFHAFKSSVETGKTNDYTADELLGHLVDAEWDDRQNRRIERTILYAKFRYKAAIEDVHYHAERSIDRNQIMRLAECTFIDRFENILVTGSTGIGKSYVASAIGHQACIRATGCSMPARPSCLPNSKWLRLMARISRRSLNWKGHNCLYWTTLGYSLLMPRAGPPCWRSSRTGTVRPR
ncbi:DNA replication protein DnaC [Mucilaginibacter terrae]|uniref:DNA replication protein DnaC n=1 Tax=Mucilaginibacter terrae TaxID=1955052 RepID=A0ABU3GV08_9SPHI|nr:DNA replication protein DnaC [Mucilaginibacter terrae]